MSDDTARLVDVLADVPVEPGKLGHHTLLNAGGVRVIALSFDEGHELREHRAPHPILLQALDGHLRVIADDLTYDLLPGSVLYLPAGLPHAVDAVEPSRLTITMVGV